MNELGSDRVPVRRRGLMLVLSSPSGAGKSTVARRLIDREPSLVMSVSVTTRPPRNDETDGVDYCFVDKARFANMVDNGEFLEHALVFDNLYGTPRRPVEAALAEGRDIIFDVDWQGAQQLRQTARIDVVSVFILPPSYEELERRLHARGQDTDDVVRRRMARATDEMGHWCEYDYVVVNADINATVEQVHSILRAERLRRNRRQRGLAELVATMSGHASM